MLPQWLRQQAGGDEFAAWVLNQSFKSPFETGFAEEDDLRHGIRVLEDSGTLRGLSAEHSERVLWNIMMMYEPVRHRAKDVDVRLAFVRTSVPFIESWWGGIESQSEALFMWWDGPARDREQVVRGEVFVALVRLLQNQNPFVQHSALHGFNHLRDKRCARAIRHYLRSCNDDYLRRYAEHASRFELM